MELPKTERRTLKRLRRGQLKFTKQQCSELFMLELWLGGQHLVAQITEATVNKELDKIDSEGAEEMFDSMRGIYRSEREAVYRVGELVSIAHDFLSGCFREDHDLESWTDFSDQWRGGARRFLAANQYKLFEELDHARRSRLGTTRAGGVDRS